jgi:hypothetical protein
LLRLVAECQFDTIYHEHFSYLSLSAVQRIFLANGLTVFDVEELPTHGGSLRVYAQRSDTGQQPVRLAVTEMLQSEQAAGVTAAAYYSGLQPRADRIKYDLLRFLIDAKLAGKSVVAYGAAAKGNTLLNYAGVRPDLLPGVVDLNPAKQDKFMPGSRIPIVGPQYIESARPDHVLILPWNLKNEVMQQLDFIRQWGGSFVTAVPRLEIHA